MVPPALVHPAHSSILPVSNLHAFERFHMGIALLAFSGLFQGLTHLTRPSPLASKPRDKAPVRPFWLHRHSACLPSTKTNAQPQRFHATPKAPALRVLRVTESDQRVKGAGRMVISGRMADVCAELDRLAALEASQSCV
jgi:hypothetical protein